MSSSSRGWRRPSFAIDVLTPKPRGRRESRVRAAPAVSCANSCIKKTRTRAYRFSGGIRLSLRSGLRLISRSPRRSGFACHRRRRNRFRRLDANPEAVRTTRLRHPLQRPRQERHPRPPHPRPALVTLRNAPLGGSGCEIYSSDFASDKQKYFSARGWTDFGVICPSGSHTTATRRCCIAVAGVAV